MTAIRSSTRAAWPDQRTVWRWHFYAGLFCAPFVIVLAASGSIYLFKTEIEAWLDRDVDRLVAAGPAVAGATVAEQTAAALAAVPGSTLKALELPEPVAGAAARRATRVIVDRDGEASRVYVHPASREILKTVPEQDRFMRKIFRLHGELWMGDRGSMLVELAASWTIVMILTGLVLWWPRQARGLAGVVYPRLGGGRRIFWRDMHAVTGVWISGLALALLLSGLPWAKSWGNYFKLVRRLTGTAVTAQDWSNGGESRRGAAEAGGHAGHGGGGRRGPGRDLSPEDLAAIDRVCSAVRPLGLDPPVLVAPPRKAGGDWSVKSDTANRPRRVDLTVSGDTGAIESRRDFRDKHVIDRIVAYGIAAHEGQLFGWPNQLLGLLTAMGLVLVSVSGIVMWWRRRPPGVLGAPPAPPAGARRSFGLLAAIGALAIYLPLFGVSLAAVLLLEWLVLRRVPAIRDWLGLDLSA
jgi:uncharacterized iron-regulated membrane protein